MIPKHFFKGWTQEKIYQYQVGRWKARTDLGWLCREILDYPDVSDKNGGPHDGLHQPLIDVLQKFPVPTREQFEQHDRIVDGQWVYRPLVSLPALPGKRRTLILDSRGHLKTTVNSEAHTIQWILNYPDIAILIFQASDSKAADILFEIKRHFQFNDKFRNLFPEHVPWKGVGDFGSMQRFTSEARRPSVTRKEPTVMTGAIETGAAGYHFDVIKFSDIVNENNVAGTGLENVKRKFYISENLLVGPNYWIDVEGTRYHFADTYGKIIEDELKIPEKDREYKIFMRSVFKRTAPAPSRLEDLVEWMKSPFQLDENGRRIPWWPQRFALAKLEKMEARDPYIFACQQLNWPASTMAGSLPFPVNDKFPKMISRGNYEQNVRIIHKEVCVDTAHTANTRSNFSSIATIATDSYGRKYVEEIDWGRFLPDDLIQHILKMALKHLRHLKSVKIEKTQFVVGLEPSIRRELETKFLPRGIIVPIELIAPTNQMSKTDRILKFLQPWYANGDLRFLDDINPDAWTRLKKEMEEFPNSESDDILDSLALGLAEQDWYGREQGKLNPMVIRKDRAGNIDPRQIQDLFTRIQADAFDKWLQIGEDTPFGDTSNKSSWDPYYDKTGGL